MTKFKFFRGSTHVQFFSPVRCFNGRKVFGRFFNMVYDALASKITVAPGEFSMHYAAALGDMRAVQYF